MEVGQGPNLGFSAKEKKKYSSKVMMTALQNMAVARNIDCGNAPKLNYHSMKFSVYLFTL
jgi:hypothetical protein